jgi:ureidoacrylate peracid hydrolase
MGAADFVRNFVAAGSASSNRAAVTLAFRARATKFQIFYVRQPPRRTFWQRLFSRIASNACESPPAAAQKILEAVPARKIYAPTMPTLDAKPDPLEIDFHKSAIIVVDMQNAFASPGGMLDIAGLDISGAPPVVRAIRAVLDAARAAQIPIIYLQMGYKPDLSNGGGPSSPNWHKELAMSLMRSRPELKGKILTEGTWDFAIVDELAPQPDDLVVVKTRYSGFAGTTLDSLLRLRGIKYLFFAGIATNVCVESTLRDAFFLDYWPILLADGAMPAGDAAQHRATLFNVESFFGWTMHSTELLKSLKLQPA